MNTEKLDPKIKNDLFSPNAERVVSAINHIKERGNKLYLPILFELLASQPEDIVATEIKKLLGSVKSKDAVSYFAEALVTEKFKSIQKSLLTACWQNGLDYAEYWPLFVEIVINEEWEIAFEAFTVVENMDHLPETQTIDQLSGQIQSALKTATGHKEYFLQEILEKLS